MQKGMILATIMVMGAVAAWAGPRCCPSEKPADNAAAAKSVACKAGDTVYVCETCNTCEAKAGKCAKCGADYKAMHLLSLLDGVATLCPCEAGCKCTIKADDATKCGCGKAVVTLQCGKGEKKCAAPKVEVD